MGPSPHSSAFVCAKIWQFFVDHLELVKFVMCILVSRVHMMFYILTKGYTIPGNRGKHDKLNQIQYFYLSCVRSKVITLRSTIPG